MTRYYLYSIQVLAPKTTLWDRHIYLFFVDEHGFRIVYRLLDYYPSLLVRFNDDQITTTDCESILIEDLGGYVQYQTYVNDIHEEQMTPLVGFTNDHMDTLIVITIQEIGKQRKIRNILGHHGAIEYHTTVSDTMKLLHQTGWTLQSWYNIDHTKGSLHSTRYDCRGICQSAIHLLSDVNCIPPISYICVRIRAKSSTATRSNRYAANYSINDDVVTHVGCSYHRIDKTGSDCHKISSWSIEDHGDSESEMLVQIGRWIQRVDPCIILHISDPFDQLGYLYFRMKLHGLAYLPFVSGFSCIENKHMKDNTYRDLTIPGREVIDMTCVLQKFMVSPNLDGYTMSDAYAHPGLIRDKSTLQYDGPYTDHLSTIDTIHVENKLLSTLEKDNGFILNNMALSRSCDVNLSVIISRGQQIRAFACFSRAYHRERVYINHDILESQYVTIAKKRVHSSYVDAEWLPNPSLESIYGHTPTTVRTQTNSAITKSKTRTLCSYFHQERPKRKENPSHISTKHQPPTNKRYGGGFVIKPNEGQYSRPEHATITLDFSSLYPSIMRGYRMCYMRLCYDRTWLDDERATKEYIPLDDDTCCVFISHYDGIPVRSITDNIIADVMQNRKRVRQKMRQETDPFVKKSLDAQQLCCKILQNAFYGAVGSETFHIPCTAIAASVCTIGQWMNKKVRHMAISRGCICVYGDTDSVMVQIPTPSCHVTRDDILRHVYTEARKLERDATSMFEPPNAVEFETCKLPFLMTTKKKTYAAFEYPPTDNGWNQQRHLLVKGFTFKKRDRCSFVKEIGSKLLIHLLDDVLSDHAIVTWFKHTIHEIFDQKQTDHETLRPFIITCRLNNMYKNDNVLAVHLADTYEQETGLRPHPGHRMKFVIAYYTDGRKHFQSAVPISMFLRMNMYIDTRYYLYKQLLLSLKQLLDLRPTLFGSIHKTVRDYDTKLHNTRIGLRSISDMYTVCKNMV